MPHMPRDLGWFEHFIDHITLHRQCHLGIAVSVFERIALPLLFLAGLSSLRNAVWLALAAGVSGPLLVEAAWRPSRGLPDAARRINRRLAAGALALTAVVVAGSLARPASSLESA